jgi:hypothetical protein
MKHVNEEDEERQQMRHCKDNPVGHRLVMMRLKTSNDFGT